MTRITLEEYCTTHDGEGVSVKLFDRLAQRARDLTEELCYGRCDRKEDEQRRAMKEMIAYWLELNGGAEGEFPVLRESVGNYSVTHAEPPALFVGGVPVSPAALLILQKAGLRDGHV